MVMGDTPFSEGRERKKHVAKNVGIQWFEERDLWMQKGSVQRHGRKVWKFELQELAITDLEKMKTVKVI